MSELRIEIYNDCHPELFHIVTASAKPACGKAGKKMVEGELKVINK